LPGDLIFFAMAHPGTDKVDHVGVYLGKGWFAHASVSNGVHIEQISKPYYMARLVGIRKFEGF
ncbi:MAG: NlpC/P60 family protein, partial [Elusimicrobia bacterium]|nr:NlpC/P60 family protein [Elusimicrobiota bacterium]